MAKEDGLNLSCFIRGKENESNFKTTEICCIIINCKISEITGTNNLRIILQKII